MSAVVPVLTELTLASLLVVVIGGAPETAQAVPLTVNSGPEPYTVREPHHSQETRC